MKKLLTAVLLLASVSAFAQGAKKPHHAKKPKVVAPVSAPAPVEPATTPAK